MPATATPVSVKKPQLSGQAVLLESIAQLMQGLNDVIWTAFALSGPDTPCQRQEALKEAQRTEKSWCTHKQLLSLIQDL